MKLKVMQEYAIFDFDGTLTQLNVDWDSLRRKISISRISEIWDFTETKKQKYFEIVTAIEILGLSRNLLIDRKHFSTLYKFGVLTNNSEKTVATFFNGINKGGELPMIYPDFIIGRETLEGPKENQKIFTKGVQLSLNFMRVSSPSDCLYIGDQDYEIILAKQVGLSVVNAIDFH